MITVLRVERWSVESLRHIEKQKVCGEGESVLERTSPSPERGFWLVSSALFQVMGVGVGDQSLWSGRCGFLAAGALLSVTPATLPKAPFSVSV